MNTSTIENKREAFAFGKNWQNFVENHLNEERIEEATESLLKFCGKDCIKDKTFLDIGCGSGLFSLAALRLGAKKVLSMDIDEDSVSCSKNLKQMIGDPDNWEVLKGSVLDEAFMDDLGKFDFVYSWGVLHHTGAMWKAIDNAIAKVDNNGSLYLAIYNKADGFQFMPDGRIGNSMLWFLEKKIYIKLPAILQSVIDFACMFAMIFVYLLTLRNPIKMITSHKHLRGMSWAVDIKDWLGGYPYEYASADEIFVYVKAQGFNLANLKTNNGLLNNEFLFTRV
jgi:2-polyprenyl-3-methyl-5-hydroxy-6-metoxy-1,4-benzoquinol methylase